MAINGSRADRVEAAVTQVIGPGRRTMGIVGDVAADVMLYLASEESSYLIGVVINVDGGPMNAI